MLGPTDAGVSVRRLMLEAAHALEQGISRQRRLDPKATGVRAARMAGGRTPVETVMVDRFGDKTGRIPI